MFLLALAFVANVAFAKSDCDALKPEQRLSEEKERALSLSLVMGTSKAGQGAGSSESSTDFAVLKEDALARAWFTYQVCVLRESGMMSREMADAAMAKLFGLEPAPAAPTEAAPTTARTRPKEPVGALTRSGSVYVDESRYKWTQQELLSRALREPACSRAAKGVKRSAAAYNIGVYTAAVAVLGYVGVGAATQEWNPRTNVMPFIPVVLGSTGLGISVAAQPIAASRLQSAVECYSSR